MQSVPSVGYVRMSTDRQETSPEQQRVEILAYAEKHGYKILKWFEDLGISGDKTEKRLGFLRMIEEAKEGRFKSILCWDQDRFGRFDSLESGYWIHPLRANNVTLVTCVDGPVDWTNFAGRVIYSIKQEGKHQYLVDLSNNVTRNMRQMAREGVWICGRPPIGYVVDPDTRKLKLGDPHDVEMVQTVFDLYVHKGFTSREISTEMSKRGYRSPRTGGVPGVRLILELLRNPIYTGDAVYGARSDSKYQPRVPTRRQPTENHIIVENAHPAIVSKADFAKAERLRTIRHHGSKNIAKGKHFFVLSGLLRCAHCGAAMTVDGYNDAVHYTCRTYKDQPGSCKRYNIKQETALPIIMEELKKRLFTPKIIEKVRGELIKRFKAAPKVEARNYENQIRSIENKIEAAQARLLEVSKDMIPRVESAIRSLESQKASLVKLQSETPEAVAYNAEDIKIGLSRAMDWFANLEKVTASNCDGRLLRNLLLEVIDGVDMKFERIPEGTKGVRHKCVLVSGTIRVKLHTLLRSGPPMRNRVRISEDVLELHFERKTA